MFTNKEIREYADLLFSLNEKKTLPKNYRIIFSGGGKDLIQNFHLVSNSVTKTFVIWVHGTNFAKSNDIKINLDTTPVQFYQGTCHGGYFRSAKAIINLIHDHLLKEENNKIVCLGHSLGGAISSVIATIFNKGNWGQLTNIDEIKEKYQQGGIKALIFGTPPTFSKTINDDTKTFITSIILEHDIVPKLGNTFNTLKIFQQIVTFVGMIYYKAIRIKSDKIDIFQIFKINPFSEIKADRTPGKVIVLNDTISFMGNHREIQKASELLKLMDHLFKNYYKHIKKLVDINDNVFLQGKLIKEQLTLKSNIPQNKSNFLLLYSKIGQDNLQLSFDDGADKDENKNKLKDNISVHPCLLIFGFQKVLMNQTSILNNTTIKSSNIE